MGVGSVYMSTYGFHAMSVALRMEQKRRQLQQLRPSFTPATLHLYAAVGTVYACIRQNVG